jgi:hypothetical protein
VAGRFFVKARRKRRTVYAVTDRRAIINADSSVTDQLLPNSSLSVTRHRRRNHLTVISGWSGRSLRGFNSYGNTGMEGLAGSTAPMAFYDIADVNGLVTALDLVPWGGTPLCESPAAKCRTTPSPYGRSALSAAGPSVLHLTRIWRTTRTDIAFHGTQGDAMAE